MEGDPNVGSSSSSANKKRNRTSKVWDEMTEVNIGGKVKAVCKHCTKEFPADSKDGTTRLWNHLHRCRHNPNKRKGPGGRDRDDQDQSLSPSIKTKELARLIKEKSFLGVIKHLSDPEGDTSDQECEDWPDLNPWVLNSRKDEILQLYQEGKEKLCQFLNNLSCRFTLRLVCRNTGMDRACLLEVNYIDDSWKRQSKVISFWHRPRDHIKNLAEAVKQSCMDWKIDTNICSLILSLEIDTADGLDNEIGEMESWFSQRRSLPFAGCLLNLCDLRNYVKCVLRFEDYVRDGIRSLNECARYVDNKSTSDKLIQLDRAVKHEISWDTFEHLEFLRGVTECFPCETRDIPIIVDLPYVHKILKDRYNHTIEDCLFCQKVMKGAIDLFLSKHYSVRVIAVILDPRFKMDGVQLHYKEIYGSDADRYLEKVNQDFRDVYDAYAATDSSNSKSYGMLDAMGRPSSPISELDLYMKELKVPAVQEFDILAWWRGNASFYPTLARMARDYLALKIPFAYGDDRGALIDLKEDIDYINRKFTFCGLHEIITPLLCFKGFFISAEN